MWNEEYEKLTSYEKGEFRRIANYLLSRTYMVRFTYDSVKEMTLPNSDYSMLARLFSVLQEYFEVTGWKLEKDDDYGIVSLISEFDNNRFKLNRFTTLFLYVCRLIYEENRLKTREKRLSVHSNILILFRKWSRFSGQVTVIIF